MFTILKSSNLWSRTSPNCKVVVAALVSDLTNFTVIRDTTIKFVEKNYVALGLFPVSPVAG
jgi:hypothetical protein